MSDCLQSLKTVILLTKVVYNKSSLSKSSEYFSESLICKLLLLLLLLFWKILKTGAHNKKSV